MTRRKLPVKSLLDSRFTVEEFALSLQTLTHVTIAKERKKLSVPVVIFNCAALITSCRGSTDAWAHVLLACRSWKLLSWWIVRVCVKTALRTHAHTHTHTHTHTCTHTHTHTHVPRSSCKASTGETECCPRNATVMLSFSFPYHYHYQIWSGEKV